MNKMLSHLLLSILAVSFYRVSGKLASEEDANGSGLLDLDDSSERVGASVTQITEHPYTASVLNNSVYVCSGIVLNTYWLVTASKCFHSETISTYVTHKNLANYTVRVGSSYNSKGGEVFKIKMLINNFDMKVSGVKLQSGLTLGPRVAAARLPQPDDEVSLGYLASIVAWTPSGHIRVVNAPIIDPGLCEPYTQMVPGHYICLGGVQDPNRHFCRKDDGGAVIQNDTLVGIATFLHTCATYTKLHAFPKTATMARWLDSIIWDEETRPSTSPPTTTTEPPTNATERTESQTFIDPRKFLLTLPYDPINVPLEPAGDNSVIPRMSLYESYLQNLVKSKTSTPRTPSPLELKKRAWLEKYGKAALMMPPAMFARKYDTYEYN